MISGTILTIILESYYPLVFSTVINPSFDIPINIIIHVKHLFTFKLVPCTENQIIFCCLNCSWSKSSCKLNEYTNKIRIVIENRITRIDMAPFGFLQTLTIYFSLFHKHKELLHHQLQ